jgi:hypothetical protein
VADLSFLDPNMNSTDETPMGAVSPDLSFLDPDQGVKPADPSALINARELTHGMDPQRTAKVINLSRKAGLPPRIVEERMDEIERREKLNDGLLADVASKAPKTTSFLSDPDRFAVAQTDIENLAELERLIATGPVDSFAMSGQMPVNGDNKLAKELIADPIGAIGKGLIKAPGSLAEMGLNLFSILPGAIDSAAQGVEQLTGLPRGGYFGELRDAALGASKGRTTWTRSHCRSARTCAARGPGTTPRSCSTRNGSPMSLRTYCLPSGRPSRPTWLAGLQLPVWSAAAWKPADCTRNCWTRAWRTGRRTRPVRSSASCRAL